MAYADNVLVVIRDERDGASLAQALSLHSEASSAKINENKSLALHLSDPPIQVPYPPVPPGENFRYLGALFKKEGSPSPTPPSLHVSEVSTMLRPGQE
ncbi:MAG: hypothetical protein DHS80DRAFT_30708 [Piptocephalis tieghemiana]|nr:MAG: hypothetical protein DHS80DRAFT_30708 [Piptocephalis tieghemiana]